MEGAISIGRWSDTGFSSSVGSQFSVFACFNVLRGSFVSRHRLLRTGRSYGFNGNKLNWLFSKLV